MKDKGILGLSAFRLPPSAFISQLSILQSPVSIMFATVIRYGIVALAAALAAMSDEEARGCGARGCRHHRCNHGDRSIFRGDALVVHPSLPAEKWTSPLVPPPPFPPHRPPVVVPPGTLGFTYRRISRLVPEDEHPRTGMIDIFNVPAGMQVTIAGMEGYLGNDGVWHFRTIRPLLPCNPTIRTAYLHSPLGIPVVCGNYRAFRLIPGRIVSLRW